MKKIKLLCYSNREVLAIRLTYCDWHNRAYFKELQFKERNILGVEVPAAFRHCLHPIAILDLWFCRWGPVKTFSIRLALCFFTRDLQSWDFSSVCLQHQEHWLCWFNYIVKEETAFLAERKILGASWHPFPQSTLRVILGLLLSCC